MAIDPNKYYRTVDDANDYFDEQLHNTDWTGASDDDKAKALLASSRAVDRLKYSGVKKPVYDLLEADSDATQAEQDAAADTQVQEFPRNDQTTSTTQTIYQFASDPTGGDFTVKLTLTDGTTFTTAAIAYDADAATIEAAIDLAATAAVTGWVNGDIAVSGGTLLAAGADVVLTFSGDSVSGSAHKTTPVIDGTGLTGGSLASPASRVTISGQCPDKVFHAVCEEAIALIAGKDPEQEFENLVLTSEQRYLITSDRTGMPPRHISHGFTSVIAWFNLQPFLDDNNTFEFERVN